MTQRRRCGRRRSGGNKARRPYTGSPTVLKMMSFPYIAKEVWTGSDRRPHPSRRDRTGSQTLLLRSKCVRKIPRLVSRPARCGQDRFVPRRSTDGAGPLWTISPHRRRWSTITRVIHWAETDVKARILALLDVDDALMCLRGSEEADKGADRGPAQQCRPDHTVQGPSSGPFEHTSCPPATWTGTAPMLCGIALPKRVAPAGRRVNVQESNSTRLVAPEPRPRRNEGLCLCHAERFVGNLRGA